MKKHKNFPTAKILITLCLFGFVAARRESKVERTAFSKTATVAGFSREFGEPFGVAVKDNFLYISDGERGKFFRVSMNGKIEILTDRLDTPSQIVFDRNGDLIVVDAARDFSETSPVGM